VNTAVRRETFVHVEELQVEERRGGVVTLTTARFTGEAVTLNMISTTENI